MPNSRRLARELALRILFQIDVGGQPIDEVFDGSLDQIRITVRNPIAQVLRDAQRALRSLANEASRDAGPHGARQIKSAARAATMHLAQLANETADHVRAVISQPPTDTVSEVQSELDADRDRCVLSIRQLTSRQVLWPDVVAGITSTGTQYAQHLADTCNKHLPRAVATADFARELVNGVIARQVEIDTRISALARGWSVDRQPAVDRNILRLAAFELLFLPTVPPAATINEAVELAKRYSTAESGRFVNGVLGTLAGNQCTTSDDGTA